MSYESVLAQIKAAPEACLDEISQIIGYVVHHYARRKRRKRTSQAPVLRTRCLKPCR